MKAILKILLGLTPGICLAGISEGGYFGFELGAANQIVQFNPAAFNLNTNGSSLYNPALGFLSRFNLGYNLNKYAGFELGTTYNFATGHNYPSGNGILSTTATAIDLSYLLYLPTIIDKWSVFGRVGGAFNWIGSEGICNCNTSSVINPSGSSFADVLGAGIMYRLTPSVSFRLEWISNALLFPVEINNSGTSVGKWTNQTFQAGFNYHF